MMKNTGYILALCLTASGHVLAHDVWITGKQAENNVIAEIGYGHNFPSKGTIPDRRDFFETPRLYNGKETITLKRKRLVRTVLIFTESSDQLSRATDRVPGLPASPGYVQ